MGGGCTAIDYEVKTAGNPTAIKRWWLMVSVSGITKSLAMQDLMPRDSIPDIYAGHRLLDLWRIHRRQSGVLE